MKYNFRLRFLSLITAIFCLSGLASCGKNTTVSNEKEKKEAIICSDEECDSKIKSKDGFTVVAENSGLRLSVNSQTAEINVEDINTGATWRSNPEDSESDTVANGVNKEILNSQLNIEYIRTSDNLAIQVNSDSGCKSYGRYWFYKINNGIGVRYALGEPVTVQLIPKVISVEHFQKILDKLDFLDKQTLNYNYTLLSLKNYSDAGTRTALLEQYPILQERDIYVLGGSSIGAVDIGDILAAAIDKAFRNAGYTADDLDEDYKENKVEYEKKDDYTVYLSVEYTIADGKMSVCVPKDSIQYDEDILSLSNISLLPMFSAGSSRETGQIVLPDGCGAVISFNNGKTNIPEYNRQVYTNDYSVSVTDQSGEQTENLYLPVFGERTEQKAFLAIIENGDTVARIHADVSGKSNSYNYVYPSFKIKEFDTVNNSVLNLSGNKVAQKTPFDSDLSVTYIFISGKDTSYSAMAGKYREYLSNKMKTVINKTEKNDIPIYIDALGAVDYTDTLLGIPYNSLKSLTSYDEAIKILNEMKEKGIDNIIFGYKAGINDGYYNSIGNSLRPVSQLGGKNGWKKMRDWLKNNNVAFYPEVEFMYTYKNTLFDGFNKSNHTARTLTQNLAERYTYNLSTKQKEKENSGFIISSSNYSDIIQKFIDSAQRYNQKSWNIGSLGENLNSDFNEKGIIDRQKALLNVTEALGKMIDSGAQLSVTGANAYTLPYASVVKNVAEQSGHQLLIDGDIPFMQIALHGIIPYTSEALNEQNDFETSVLRCAEYGSTPYFVIMDKENFELKDSGVPIYGINYDMWKNDIVKSYNKVNSVLKGLQNCKIISHHEVSNGVFATVYDNNATILVNYNENDVAVGNVTVKAKSCIRTEGN